MDGCEMLQRDFELLCRNLCHSLRHFRFRTVPVISSLKPVALCTALQHLDFGECTGLGVNELEHLTGLENLTSLGTACLNFEKLRAARFKESLRWLEWLPVLWVAQCERNGGDGPVSTRSLDCAHQSEWHMDRDHLEILFRSARIQTLRLNSTRRDALEALVKCALEEKRPIYRTPREVLISRRSDR